MPERVFARGSSCRNVDHAISSRLDLPTNWYQPDSEKPPGLSFNENDLEYREKYARIIAKDRGKLPCVMIVHIDGTNFLNLRGNIYNSVELPADIGRTIPRFNSETIFKYVPVSDFKGIHKGIIAITVSNLSDMILIALNTEVGFEHPGDKGFKYTDYRRLLKR